MTVYMFCFENVWKWWSHSRQIFIVCQCLSVTFCGALGPSFYVHTENVTVLNPWIPAEMFVCV